MPAIPAFVPRSVPQRFVRVLSAEVGNAVLMQDNVYGLCGLDGTAETIGAAIADELKVLDLFGNSGSVIDDCCDEVYVTIKLKVAAYPLDDDSNPEA